jgi:D-glycero-D-manno-heptose 1,7-bisphosphate phosphatase
MRQVGYELTPRERVVIVAFLDRDGVINRFPGHGNYVTGWQAFRFLPGSIEAIRQLNQHGFKVFVISNQQGVAKGLYTHADLDEIDTNMRQNLAKHDARVDGIFYCTHLADDDCDCRKPKTGLLDRAAATLGATIEESVFIGDSMGDMLAAKAFGARPVLVLSGKEEEANRERWRIQPELVFEDLRQAVVHLCSERL